MYDLKDLRKLSEGKERAPFLRAMLKGLIYDEYEFPTEGSDGEIGPFTISRAKPLYLRKRGGAEKTWSVLPHDTLALLSAHFNFKIHIGQIKESNTPTLKVDLDLDLSLLHLTVRRHKCQLQINENGPTGECAKQSIHMGLNTEWASPSRSENLARLVDKLEEEDKVKFTREDILSYLQEYEGLNAAWMGLAATKLLDAIKKTIQTNMPVRFLTIKTDNLDSSWK